MTGRHTLSKQSARHATPQLLGQGHYEEATPASGKFAAAISGGPGGEVGVLATALSYQLIAAISTDHSTAPPRSLWFRRGSEYYLAHIGEVKSIDDFLGNDRLFQFTMKAFGLQAWTTRRRSYARSGRRRRRRRRFCRQALRQALPGLCRDLQFCPLRRLDDRLRPDAAGHGRRLRAPDAGQEAGDQNQGVRLALYFQRKAPDLKAAYEIWPIRVAAGGADGARHPCRDLADGHRPAGRIFRPARLRRL